MRYPSPELTVSFSQEARLPPWVMPVPSHSHMTLTMSERTQHVCVCGRDLSARLRGLMLAFTQLSRTNLQGLCPGHPRCTNARVTTHVPEAPGVVALALATGCFCGLGGVLAEHLSPACFVRLE